MATIREGDTAPEFEAVGHAGQTVRLADFRGKQPVVLFFYPKDGTPICTREACAFRDAYEDFVAAGAAVIGVSGDPAESHRAFAEAHRLPFTLLSDPGGSLRRLFGVPKTLGVLPGRVTYVIDAAGVVRCVFNSQMFAGRHVAEALRVLRELG
jgi:peroxiredoxin Q/BCP